LATCKKVPAPPPSSSVTSTSFGQIGGLYSGRDVPRLEPTYDLDFSLLKNVPIRERIALQLRFEAFNILNFQILGTPATTIGQSNAGLITNISSTPRQLQLGAKVTF